MIDVSDLLLDPDFTQPIKVFTRTASVNQYGENSLIENSQYVTASVQAGNGETLSRLPQGARLQDWITIYSKFYFTAASTGRYADIVLWEGKRYNVQLLTDYSNWGDGYTMADCLLEGGGNA
jgi:hypothetical protein